MRRNAQGQFVPAPDKELADGGLTEDHFDVACESGDVDTRRGAQEEETPFLGTVRRKVTYSSGVKYTPASNAGRMRNETTARRSVVEEMEDLQEMAQNGARRIQEAGEEDKKRIYEGSLGQVEQLMEVHLAKMLED